MTEGRGLRLGIDLDGVVADFNHGWTRRYNAEFGAQLAADMVRHWDGIPPLTHFEDMDQFWEWAQAASPTFFRELPLFPGARETMHDLWERHRIVIITSKHRWAITDTLAWFAEHELPADEIHFSWDKPRVPADVYLEDSPANLQLLAERRPDATVCRMVRPWNEPLPGVVDVGGWDEFRDVVRDLERDATQRTDLDNVTHT